MQHAPVLFLFRWSLYVNDGLHHSRNVRRKKFGERIFLQYSKPRASISNFVIAGLIPDVFQKHVEFVVATFEGHVSIKLRNIPIPSENSWSRPKKKTDSEVGNEMKIILDRINAWKVYFTS